MSNLCKLTLLEILLQQFRLDSVGVKVKKNKPDLLSSHAVNPMLEKLNSKFRETKMRRDMKKKAAILGQTKKKVMLKMKEM